MSTAPRSPPADDNRSLDPSRHLLIALASKPATEAVTAFESLDLAPEVWALDGADLVVDSTTPAVSIDIVKAAAERGWIDGDAVALEQITAIKRAGADLILTYLAREMAETLGA